MALPYVIANVTPPANVSILDSNFSYLDGKISNGVWTPTLSFVTPGNLVIAYSSQIGTYHLIDDYVIAHFTLVTSTFTHTTASGNAVLSGMPYSAAATPAGHHWGGEMILWQGVTKANYTQLSTRLSAGSGTSGRITCSGSGQTGTTITAADMPTGGSVILQGVFRYQKA
jgi:hypothetical protein